MSNLNANKVVKTALLPGILPRIRELTHNSFSTLAYLIALLYASVKLLPPGHPFTNPANKGRFGLINVISEAAVNLKFDRKHIDQVIIFFTIALGLVLLVAQAGLLVVTVMFNTAWAQTGLFFTANPDKDIAFGMLDQVFGVPGIYGSAFDTASGGIPPFQSALHNMFALYSYVMLLAGVVIFLYYILVTIFETAQTGQPFGQRFDTVWAPIRLIVALGLLIPFSYGLNSAQYAVLYAAKYGSGLATNGWVEFNRVLAAETGIDNATPLGYKAGVNEEIILYKDRNYGSGLELKIEINEEAAQYRRSLIALPQQPDMAGLANSLLLINTCLSVYSKINADYNVGRLGHFLVSSESVAAGSPEKLHLDLVQDGLDSLSAGPFNIDSLYQTAKEFYGEGDIIVRFGERNVSKYPDEDGNVKALCGEITIPVTNLGVLNQGAGDELSPAQEFQKSFLEYITFFTIQDPFSDNSLGDLGTSSLFGRYWAERELPPSEQGDQQQTPRAACEELESGTSNPFSVPVTLNQTQDCDQAPEPDSEFYKFVLETVKADTAIDYQRLYESALGLESFTGIDVSISEQIFERGWGGAAIWYNRIAEINGMIVTASQQIPKLTRMPLVMEEVAEIKKKKESKPDFRTLYEPIITNADERDIVFASDPSKQRIAATLYNLYSLSSTGMRETSSKTQDTGFFFSMINSLLGTEGIYDMRENVQVHPLAQLTTIGRSMIEAAMRNLAISAASGLAGGVFSSLFQNPGMGEALSGASGFFSSFVSISLAAGFILYYIVPFMPFLFFFFAMISWVKTIFEAMVGVPLWALAHLRIEGPGLPGDAAVSGYILIFDIFLRPIMILFGLLAASVIFFTEVYLLHIVFDMVVGNLAGNDPACLNAANASDAPEKCSSGASGTLLEGTVNNVRGQVDAFFYTILYTIFVYMMANSTFKLVDAIPKGILRWMGDTTQTFSDNSEDPTENLTRSVGIGGMIVGQQVAGAVPQVTGKVGQGAGTAMGPRGLNLFGGRGSGGGGGG